MKYRVVIKDYETDEPVWASLWTSKINAEKIDDGRNINLNHDKFYTVIEEADNGQD
ncbi:hypothetical protein LCGC14_2857750 [marine sediment metagenome]|uniref:Uncharacterized protein n=1 Tax=marine sediment metagenome TaxID=412755 RepID=A0A0F8YTC4_9ZZZZ